MTGTPLTTTWVPASTMTLTSPMIALAVMVMSRSAKVAALRSRVTLPIIVNAVCSAGTSQAPWRLHSPITAIEELCDVVAGSTSRFGTGFFATGRCWLCAGRSIVIGTRSAYVFAA